MDVGFIGLGHMGAGMEPGSTLKGELMKNVAIIPTRVGLNVRACFLASLAACGADVLLASGPSFTALAASSDTQSKTACPDSNAGITLPMCDRSATRPVSNSLH